MRLACLNSEEIDSGYWHIKPDKEICTSYTTSYDTVMCQTLSAVSLMTIYTLYRSHQGVVHTAYWPDYGMEPTKPVTL